VAQGGQFEIVNARLFESEVMPQYFRTRNASSFKRLMRMYGFRKAHGRWIEGTFEHELFHRDYPEMASTIQRTERPGEETGVATAGAGAAAAAAATSSPSKKEN
jgi:hypothetical protein